MRGDDTLDMIRTESLSKEFHRGSLLKKVLKLPYKPPITAVKNAQLSIGEGEIFGLLGPNGAGKTTLIKMLCTLLFPTSGSAKVGGYDVVHEGRRVRKLIGLVASDERSFYWRLTGRQNLRFFAAIHKLFGKAAEMRIDELIDSIGLRKAADQRFCEYSTGMRQRLAIARGLLKRPRVLFMDEPSKGVDPVDAQRLLGLIKDYVVGSHGNTVFITTHILREVEQICDRVAVMNRGSIIAGGTIEEIRESVTTDQKYLLQIDGFSNGFLPELAQIKGVVKYAQRGMSNGRMSLEVYLEQDDSVFPALMEHISRKRGRVVKCVLKESSFDEIFRSLFDK